MAYSEIFALVYSSIRGLQDLEYQVQSIRAKVNQL